MAQLLANAVAGVASVHHPHQPNATQLRTAIACFTLGQPCGKSLGGLFSTTDTRLWLLINGSTRVGLLYRYPAHHEPHISSLEKLRGLPWSTP
jgi:hypothetical protein